MAHGSSRAALRLRPTVAADFRPRLSVSAWHFDAPNKDYGLRVTVLVCGTKNVGRSYVMRRGDFETLVDEAWETIPSSFRNRFSNVAIFVEDEPSREHLRAGRVPRGGTLLGLYEGVPLARRGHHYGMVLPDRITLFQGPIERAAGSRDEVAQIVYDTLWHELAHHLGMDEKEVRAAERRRGVP